MEDQSGTRAQSLKNQMSSYFFLFPFSFFNNMSLSRKLFLFCSSLHPSPLRFLVAAIVASARSFVTEAAGIRTYMITNELTGLLFAPSP